MKCLICNEDLFCFEAETTKVCNEGGIDKDFPVRDSVMITAKLKCSSCDIEHVLSISGFTMKIKLAVVRSCTIC